MGYRALLKTVILGPVAIAVILFCVANRGLITVTLDPITQGAEAFSVKIPLYALVLAVLLFGVVLGGISTWLSQRGHRKGERYHRKEAERLRLEADQLRAHIALASAPKVDGSSGTQLVPLSHIN